MRDFMRVILFQLTCPGDLRAKDVLFQSSCNLYPESHKTQHRTADLQICVKRLRHTIEKSDAMLYAPSIHDIKDNCRNMSLQCYMLELIMVLIEEGVVHNKTECILAFNDTIRPEDGCPPCETYPLKNITVFLERLNTLLENMTYRDNIT